jgi:hypothetical protein
MKALLRIIGALAALLILVFVLALAGAFSVVDEVRYRLSVEFDTPDGVRGGASVIRVTRKHPLPIDPIKRYGWNLEGDAIFVDLGQARTPSLFSRMATRC